MDHVQAGSKEKTQKQIWWIAAFVAVVGLALSVYSVMHHLELRANGHTAAACNVNASINCDAVASSKYSEIAGIPVGVFGIGYFLAMLFFAATVASDHKTRKDNEPTWFLMVGIGLLSSIVFGAISLGMIQVVCLVCISVYGVTAVQAGLAYSLIKSSGMPKFESKLVGNGVTSAVLALVLAVVGYNFIKPQAELPKELQDVAGKHDNLAKSTSNLLPMAKEIAINRTQYSGVGEDYRLGNDDAKVVVVEFADYQCPACADAKKTVDDLHKAMGDRILIVFKNYPLSNKCNSTLQSDMHPFSCDIAKLARCAGQYGKFWEFHRMAFEQQRQASLESAKGWGKAVGMTEAQMATCLASADILAKIQDDVGIGNRVGVDGTPAFFINGRKYIGERSVDGMRAAIESL